MTAYHSATANSIPLLHVDDQFAALDAIDWTSADDLSAAAAFDDAELSSHLYASKEHAACQQHFAHKPIERFIFANEAPFAFGLQYPCSAATASSSGQPSPSGVLVANPLDAFQLQAPGLHDAWQSRLSSPVDVLSYNSSVGLFPSPSCDGHSSAHAYESLISRASQSPISDYHSSSYHARSPSQPPQAFSIGTSLDAFSDHSSCIALRDVQQIPDMASQVPLTATAALANPSVILPSQAFSHAHHHHHHHPAATPIRASLSGASTNDMDAEGELDEDDYTPPSAAAVAAAVPDDALDSDTDNPDEPLNDATSSKSDASDSDYRPSRAPRTTTSPRTSRAARTPRRPSAPQRPAILDTSARITKRASHERRPSAAASRSPLSPGTDRPFTCPLLPYGCTSTFSSKNEWKRHFTIQHVRLGFWRCDLCADAATRPNDFNRKDLFKQHVRRMHRGDRGGLLGPGMRDDASTAADDDAFEAALDAVRLRCWHQLRAPPAKLACVFCDARAFDGPSCCDEWLEHVGRHLAGFAARRGAATAPGGAGGIAQRWARDATLRAWLVAEGFVERCGERFVLTERGAAGDAARRRRAGNSAARDADEVDEEV